MAFIRLTRATSDISILSLTIETQSDENLIHPPGLSGSSRISSGNSPPFSAAHSAATPNCLAHTTRPRHSSTGHAHRSHAKLLQRPARLSGCQRQHRLPHRGPGNGSRRHSRSQHRSGLRSCHRLRPRCSRPQLLRPSEQQQNLRHLEYRRRRHQQCRLCLFIARAQNSQHLDRQNRLQPGRQSAPLRPRKPSKRYRQSRIRLHFFFLPGPRQYQ